jgi:dimeric dUTPase (all-alpha-NTP-PPase superfamily)
MNLKHLFELQAKLDERIYKEHPVQEGEDRLAKKILALQVELGELANELPEVFKFWSNKKNNYEKALEELVDCLHFLLSIGLELETTNIVIDSDYTGADTTETFIFAFETVIELANSIRDGNKSYIYQVYEELFNLFVGLGEKYLGFTWEQVEKAYLDKNKINHERQESGY